MLPQILAVLLGITLQGPGGDGSASITISGTPRSEYLATLTADAVIQNISGEPVDEVTILDKVYKEDEDGSYETDYQISVEWGGDPNFSATWESGNEAVATVDDFGYVSFVSAGTVQVFLRTDHGDFGVTLDMETDSNTDVLTFYEYASNTFGADAWRMYDTAATAIADATEGDDLLSVFSAQNHDTATYTRNSANWTYGVDWSGVSPWNSDSAHRKAGVAITDRHIVFADHYRIADGSTIRFVESDGSVVTRTLTSSVQVGATDIRVGVLDSSLPEGVAKYRILPSDWMDYLPDVSGVDLPLVAFDQQEKTLLLKVTRIKDSIVGYTSGGGYYPILTEAIVSGDSGNPTFLVVDGEAVLMSVHEGPGYGAMLGNYITEIDSAITTLGGGGYSVSTISLSSYTSFAP